MSEPVPAHLADALGPVLAALTRAGYLPVAHEQSPAFGSFDVAFDGPRGRLRVLSDRGRFLLDGPPRDVLEPAGLWRAFASADDLARALRAWSPPAA